MKKSGWKKEVSGDECKFSKKIAASDEEDITISQLGSRFGLNNNIATKGLSASDCGRNEQMN